MMYSITSSDKLFLYFKFLEKFDFVPACAYSGCDGESGERGRRETDESCECVAKYNKPLFIFS